MSSDHRFVAPIALLGRTALSEEIRMKLLTLHS
jgi:hypothetical protein